MNGWKEISAFNPLKSAIDKVSKVLGKRRLFVEIVERIFIDPSEAPPHSLLQDFLSIQVRTPKLTNILIVKMENTNTLQSFVVAHYMVLKKCFPEF